MNFIQLISIVLEGIIVLVSFGIALKKKLLIGWGLALTFAIYVFYDLTNFFSWGIDQNILSPLFLIATFSALWSIWSIYQMPEKE